MASGSTNRLSELDSLRGLAAFSVVLSHFTGLWVEDALLDSPHRLKEFVNFLFLPVAAGHEAVILFFILSGYVLSLPAVHGHPQTYRVFVVRRIFRIYMPYLVAMLLALLGNIFLHGDPTRSKTYFYDFWLVPVDWPSFKQHLFLLGYFDTDRFDPPVWSLIMEMRISLLFPFLCAWVLKMRPSRAVWMAASVSACSIAASVFFDSDLYDQLIFRTLHFGSLFVVGIVLAQQGGRISAIFEQLPQKKKIRFAIFALLFYWYGGFLCMHVVRRFAPSGWDYLPDWFTACGAAGLIVLSLNSNRFKRLLHWSPIHALGRMSYSLYLLHFMVLFAFVHLLYGKLPLLVIFAVCLPVTLAVSWAFYRCVEMPFMQMGRSLSGHFCKKVVAGSPPRQRPH